METAVLYSFPCHYRTEEIRLILQYFGVAYSEVMLDENDLNVLRDVTKNEHTEPPCLLYKGQVLTQFRATVRYLCMDLGLYSNDLCVSSQMEEICSYKDRIAREMYVASRSFPEYWVSAELPKMLRILGKNYLSYKLLDEAVSMADFAVFELVYDYFLSPIRTETCRRLVDENCPHVLQHVQGILNNENVKKHLENRRNFSM